MDEGWGESFLCGTHVCKHFTLRLNAFCIVLDILFIGHFHTLTFNKCIKKKRVKDGRGGWGESFLCGSWHVCKHFTLRQGA